MNYSFSKIESGRLNDYQDLFLRAFPDAKHLNVEYLKWLYLDNPNGNVQGFDAFLDGLLVGHYACIPVLCEIKGTKQKGLLSLNTATHPLHQGKGLFTRLAQMTYDHATADGFQFVYGIANQNSTYGFVKKLGFKHICPLDAYILLGDLKMQDKSVPNFKRLWTEEDISWRLSNPCQNYLISDNLISVKTDKFNINCLATLSSDERFLSYPALFIGLKSLEATLKIKIPDSLKPSPLNLIYRNLSANYDLEANDFEIQFLDFDAY